MRFDSNSPGFMGSVARFLINVQAMTRFTTIELIFIAVLILTVIL